MTGELWTQRVMLYYVENVPGAWSYPENIGSVVIASNLGLIFQADFIDVNADGTLYLRRCVTRKKISKAHGVYFLTHFTIGEHVVKK